VSPIIQHLFDAASLGGIYALAALGIGLIFGIMGLINFAHGDFFMIGAYVIFLMSGRPVLVVTATTIVVVILLALATDRFVFRPIRGAEGAILLTASFGLSYLLENIVFMIFGGRPKAVDFGHGLVESVTIGGVRISQLDIFTIAMTAVLLIGLTLFLRKTRYGTEMRAAASDFRMARLLGIRANRVVATAFALSGALAAAVSFLLVVRAGAVSPHMGLMPVLFAFLATIIGGMGNLPGAALGGFILGFVSVGLQVVLPPDLVQYRDAFLFALVTISLALFPGGLMPGRQRGERI
jgi:branched-chain amino acid transport system permease protein